MRLETGNNHNCDHYKELSIQVTMNGYSFILSSVTGDGNRKIIGKESFEGHNILEQLDNTNVDVNSVEMVWSIKDVELIPDEIFGESAKENLVINRLNNGIVARWELNETLKNVKIQVDNYFGNDVTHIHFLQKLIDGKSLIKITIDGTLMYIVVMGLNGLESYFCGKIKSAADVLYYHSKLKKVGRNYNYQIIGNRPTILEVLEQYLPVKCVLSSNPIMMICE